MTCDTCNRDGLLYRQMLKSDGLATETCRQCAQRKRDEAKAAKVARYAGETKVCNRSTCASRGMPQPLSEFYVRSDGGDGHWARCKSCAVDMQRDYSRGKRRTNGGRKLAAVDLTPCTRCKLRGHTAGDPDKCLVTREMPGLGNQWWA